MANRRFTQFFNTLHTKPVLIDCNFVVDSTNVSGKGISSLKGPGIQSVYMNSAATISGDTHTNFVVDSIASTANLLVGMPVSGTGIPVGATIASITSATAITLSLATTATNAGVTISYAAVGSPAPAAGYALIKFQDCYNGYFAGYNSIASPQSGSSLLVASAGLTVGAVYVITILGTTSLAQWQALGVPAGITPAVGVPFVALATSATGTGAVQLPKASGSGISQIDVIGSPNLTLTSSAANVAGISSGAYMLVRFLAQSQSTHAHDLLIKGGQAPSTTNDIAYYATDILGKEQATDATIAGSASATKGGVLLASSGAISLVKAAPADGSIVSLAFYLSSSRITVQGE